jgi:hypothetical protein
MVTAFMRRSVTTVLAATALCLVASTAPAAETPPPNAPADAKWDAAAGRLTLHYNGGVVFEARGKATAGGGGPVAVHFADGATENDGKVEQTISLKPAEAKDGATLSLSGMVTASGEAFPAETQSEAQKRFEYVRNSVGLSCNLRNNAVYDRHWDWVLVGPPDGATRIVPKTDEEVCRTFEIECTGADLQLVFRPRFYQKHHGYERFEPWTYKTWEGSLTGYCTWWAYRHGFTQETLDAMLALFVQKRLPDFGYQYMQFDDTYQQGNGSCPENWLNWNEKKFPGGWKYSVEAIRDAGMKPGIWVHRIHRPNDPHVKDIALAHPDWFVRKADGSLVQHHGFHMLDATNNEAVENMVRKLYRGLKKQGWDYVKIDGTGDLLRAYQNPLCADFFQSHPTTPEDSLRKWDIVAREVLGTNVYILACHSVGNARHVIGLADGARLSNDGFQPLTLAQYSFLEGVVWRNDPDHCDVLGEWLMDVDAMMPVFGLKQTVPTRSVIRPAVCAMSGGVLMVSDKVEVYQDDRNIEGMKRSSPVLFTRPGQLYSNGRRPLEWWLQEIDKGGDRWNVLARIQWAKKREKEWKFDLKGLPEQEVKFADLGLDPEQEYAVFEFWTQKHLGKHRESFTAPAMDTNDGMDVFVLREVREYPWVLSTTRHLSQGAVSLRDVQWDAATNTLFGKSEVIGGDPYVLTLSVPAGYQLAAADIDGARAEANSQQETATVRYVPDATKAVVWKATFMREASPK